MYFLFLTEEKRIKINKKKTTYRCGDTEVVRTVKERSHREAPNVLVSLHNEWKGDLFHNHILHVTGKSVGWESISLTTAGAVSVTQLLIRFARTICSFQRTQGGCWAEPGDSQPARGNLACGSRPLSQQGVEATILHTLPLEQGRDAEPGNITCVISWETSWWLCIPLASLFLWKHMFPRVNLHWKTINGSVVL